MGDNKSPSTNGSNGRDAKGRFSTGNAGGPGNPFARRVAALRCELLSSVTAKDIRQIVNALMKKAKKGDLGAAKLILGYSIGLTAKAPDPDTLDEHEMKSAAKFYGAQREMQSEKPSIVDEVLWGIEK